MADGPVSLSRRFLLRSGWNEVVWKVVLPVVAVVLVGATALGVFLPSAMQSAAIESAYRANLQIAEQMKITRGYYTRNVVAKAVASGSLQPSYEHQGSATAIPLPATFVKDIADLLKEKDITLALVSPYPWPHRAERKMDAFQSMAWEVFQKDPTAALSRQEARDGKRVLRVAVPDRMTGETCVACHNSDPQSAKRDWKVGDVRAVMEVTKVVEPYLAAADRRSAGILAAIAATTILVVALLLGVTSLVVRRSRESVHALQQHNQALREHEEELSERNRQFDAALSNMADGLCMFDADLRIIDCNDRYRELFKLPAHVARPGAGLREVLTYSVGAGRHPGRTVDELMAERLAATAKGEPATLRTRLDGERTIEIVYRPMQGGGWVATHEDITEREQAEEALAEQNRRFDAALNNMPHGLCMFDASRRLIVCNRKYAEMYRLPHELTRPGTALEQIFEYRVETGQAPLDVDAFLQAQDRRARERKSSCYKLELHDGRMLQIEFEPMSDGGWVATHQHITEATRAEEQVHYLARHAHRIAEPRGVSRAAGRRVEAGASRRKRRGAVHRSRSVQGRQ